ncbi:MAG: extracellular solute-binding protein [Armatimonadetes bacterium]|nr:extracellular solute-binding protein [Armatimonadota bacterium]
MTATLLTTHDRSSPLCLRIASDLRWSGAIAALTLLVALSGCPPPDQTDITVTVTDSGQPSEQLNHDEVVALARREGELWWYTSLPEDQAREFLDRFGKTHPYIQTHLVRGSTFDIVRRVDREIAQGQVQADVLHVLDPAVFVDLRRRGELYAYDSPQARFIANEFQDAGRWWAMRAVTVCIAYNSRRLQADEVPHTWTGLLDERWRGKVGLKDAQTGGSAYAQYYLLREEYGASYWRRMKQARPKLYRSSSDTLRALMEGEIDLAGGILGYSVHRAATRDELPVKAVWPEDGVPMIIGPVAILSRCPHPHAAMLFIDYSLSAAGQRAMTEIIGCYSTRADVKAPAGRPPLNELKLLTPEGSWEEYRTRQERLQTEYSRLFHPESE